jgi:hypothetical protein
MKIGVLWFPAWASAEDDLQAMMHYLKKYKIEYHSINLNKISKKNVFLAERIKK